VQVIVNGESREIAAEATVSSLLKSLQLEPERVAVELDRRIVKRAQWDETLLRDGAQLEIVQFVGGG
jgi:thiamine biosynthesis protein ThiS